MSASGEVVIGLDVGTTAVKVVAFDLAGSPAPARRVVVREYPLLQPRPGWQVQQPEVVADAVLSALTDCVAACGSGRVVAVALSSAMHALIGLDADAHPLTPVLTWADSRARAEAAELRSDGRAAALHARSGTPVHPMSPLVKLVWLARHEPELFARTRTWVGLKDWVVQTLTGSTVTELSSAGGTGLLDLATRDWSAPTLELAGITEHRLPPIRSTTAVLGLSAVVADRVGLAAGTPVVLGAGDGPLGNLGVGALDPGVVGLSLGTSGAVRMVVPRPQVEGGGGLFCYALTDDHWVVGGAISNGGSALRWAGEVFGPRSAGPPGTSDEDVLASAAAVPPGCEGLVALPYLLAERAPLWDPEIAGAFLGVRSNHTRGHFVRACLEGVARQLWVVVAELDRVAPVTEVRATGGVFRSMLWRQVVADVLDRPVVVTDDAGGSALGAAALGLVALGRASGPAQARALLCGGQVATDGTVQPEPAAARTYRGQRLQLSSGFDGYRAAIDLFAPTGVGAGEEP